MILRTGGVDRIGNDGNECLWTVFGDIVGKPFNKTSVHTEEILARHAGLARDASGDDDNLGTGKRSSSSVSLVSILVVDLLVAGELSEAHTMPRNFRRRVNVREVGSYAGSTNEIEHAEVCHVLIQLEDKAERLANAAATTDYRDSDHYWVQAERSQENLQVTIILEL
jgi:hypothetical protein